MSDTGPLEDEEGADRHLKQASGLGEQSRIALVDDMNQSQTELFVQGVATMLREVAR